MTPRPQPTVRAAARGDIEVLGGVLSRAFEDDPVWQWLIPEGDGYLRRATRAFEVELRHVYMPKGATETAGRDGVPEAAALWGPPNDWRTSMGTILRQSIPLMRAFGHRMPRALRALSLIEKEHPEEPHWFLGILGTDPSAQGNGLGGALLRSRLEKADADGMPAYLESFKESNVPYYERFGFRVTKEVHLPGGGPPVWLMWRDPQRL